MRRKKSTETQRQRNLNIDVDRMKHRKYKLFAVKKGLTLKELAEIALDQYIATPQRRAASPGDVQAGSGQVHGEDGGLTWTT